MCFWGAVVCARVVLSLFYEVLVVFGVALKVGRKLARLILGFQCGICCEADMFYLCFGRFSVSGHCI